MRVSDAACNAIELALDEHVHTAPLATVRAELEKVQLIGKTWSDESVIRCVTNLGYRVSRSGVVSI